MMPFDPEIEHAGPLADQFAHGGENQRRGDADRGNPETGSEQNLEWLRSCHLQRTR
jgi:hypothetical protein